LAHQRSTEPGNLPGSVVMVTVVAVVVMCGSKRVCGKQQNHGQ
jgi:hypothetical protein